MPHGAGAGGLPGMLDVIDNLRGGAPRGGGGMIYAFGDYTLDLQRYELRRAGTLCQLEPQALDLLVYLLQHRDRVVTKQELFEHLWPERYVGPGILTQRLMMVRETIGDSGRAQHCIKTLHGRGYRFVAVVTVHATVPGNAGCADND